MAELTACGLASILVPYPYASENHQQYNAQALVDVGAAVMILDQDLNRVVLEREVMKFYNDKQYRLDFAKNATKANHKDSLEEIMVIIKKYC